MGVIVMLYMGITLIMLYIRITVIMLYMRGNSDRALHGVIVIVLYMG